MKSAVPLIDFETAAKSLTPDEYAHRLRDVELTGLTLENLTADSDKDAIAPGGSIRLRIRRDVSATANESGVTGLLLLYTVTGAVGRKRAVHIRAQYRIHLRSSSELTAEFLAIYARSSADLNVWPFLRELVHSLTSRMDVPILTLPLLQNPGVLDH